MKKIIKIVGIVLLTMLLFRGWIYRLTVNYSKSGERTTIELTDKQLLQAIEKEIGDEKMDIKQIIEVATAITNNTLSFTGNKASNNPNELMKMGKANCVGYSAMFNSIAHYLIHRNALNDTYRTQHFIGKLDFLGIDVHQFFDSSFFKDHDFNQIRNVKTGAIIISIDLSLSDYLNINRVVAE